MSERLTSAPWLDDARTAAVLDALETAGGADCARFVGGCVRNSLIGRPVEDIDLATTLTPDAVVAALNAAGLRALPTGIDHGTVTAISGSRPYEITTLRRDLETDGRHAVVAFTADWREDAARRDFTLNALYARRDGAVIDPTGHGIADAREGRVVFVGAPEARIREDFLRILRFFRFYAWYGKGAPDPAATAACGALREHLATLAAERISKELLKLLAAEDPRGAVALMIDTGVLGVLAPEAADAVRFAALVETDAGQGFLADPLLRLAALLPDEPPVAVALARRLRLSNAERDRLAAALAPAPEVGSGMGPKEVRRAIYRLGPRAFRDRARLAWAGAADRAPAGPWLDLLTLADAWTAPAFPLTGEDVAAAGVPKGPLVGRALREVEAWWVDQDFPDDRTAAIARLKAVTREIGR